MSIINKTFTFHNEIDTSVNLTILGGDQNNPSVLFTSPYENIECCAIVCGTRVQTGEGMLIYVTTNGNSIMVYNNGVWIDDAAKIITFVDTPSQYLNINSSQFEIWLTANAEEGELITYKVLESELTNIANAIRAKGDTSAPLTFPDGFISAIQALNVSFEEM